jgi:hypothetical protein
MVMVMARVTRTLMILVYLSHGGRKGWLTLSYPYILKGEV